MRLRAGPQALPAPEVPPSKCSLGGYFLVVKAALAPPPSCTQWAAMSRFTRTKNSVEFPLFRGRRRLETAWGADHRPPAAPSPQPRPPEPPREAEATPARSCRV